MGNVATLFSRKTLRILRRFNVENRTYRELEKEKRPSPLYESTIKEVEKLQRELPGSFQELQKKDENLLHNLKNLYVRSESEYVKPQPESEVRELSSSSNSSRYTVPHSDADITPLRTEKVPLGKYNTDQIVNVISQYQKSGKKASIRKLSELSHVDSKILTPILDHVRVFDLYVPPKKAQPSMLQRAAKDALPPMDNFHETMMTQHNIHTEYTKKLQREEEVKEKVKKVLEEIRRETIASKRNSEVLDDKGNKTEQNHVEQKLSK